MSMTRWQVRGMFNVLFVWIDRLPWDADCQAENPLDPGTVYRRRSTRDRRYRYYLQHRTRLTDLQAASSGTSDAAEHTEQCKGHHGSHTDGNAGQSQEE